MSGHKPYKGCVCVSDLWSLRVKEETVIKLGVTFNHNSWSLNTVFMLQTFPNIPRCDVELETTPSACLFLSKYLPQSHEHCIEQ